MSNRLVWIRRSLDICTIRKNYCNQWLLLSFHRRPFSTIESKMPRFMSLPDDQELLKKIPLEDVRCFCFIAHIDHGKSSLSSRLLEMTGNQGLKTQKMAWKTALEREEKNLEFTDEGNTATITTSDLNQNDITPDSKENIELLDTLAVEKQRGITVKATTASMLYPHPCAVGPEKVLLLNLIDTPGHVDFGREVTRTLAFVQGAVLLLDATQGIQAQTWSVYDKAKSLPNPPTLLMALTKVDLPTARPIHYSLQVSEFLEWDPDDIILTSARNRINIKKILDAVCERIPPPKPLADDTPNDSFLRAQVVDSRYDDRGVNCLVYVVSGELNEGDRIAMVSVSGEVVQQQQTSFSVQEVGIVLPKAHRTGSLQRGQMGYVRFGLRDPRQAMPGTILIWNSHVNKINEIILPEMPMSAATTNTKSVLYASVHPAEADGFEELTSAVDRLALNDTGLEVSKTSSIGSESSGPFLGPGLRVGFQGLLHVEVFRQRLQDEFNIDAVVTPPKVPYKITISPSQRSGVKEESVKLVEDLKDWPESTQRFKVEEPIVDARILARVDDAGAVMELLKRKRGTNLQTKPLDDEKWIFTARIPWAEIVTDFHDQLKNVTAGYGSLDTSEADPPFETADLMKVDLLLNNEAVEPLAFVCHKDVAQAEGRNVCKKLKEVLPRQQFVTIIQARAGGKIVASERIQAYRKDVLVKSGKVVGGGDQTRKMKLLEKQKKGKKRMQEVGRVKLSQAAFNSVITRNT